MLRPLISILCSVRVVLLLVSLLTQLPIAYAVTLEDLDLPEATCNESVFKPCICASKSPKDIKYRPSYKQCSGKAAVILGGKYTQSFSVVLRDRQNRDRYPAVGFNGCTKAQADAGLARCSAYKCQKKFTDRKTKEKVCCFGGSGKSKYLRKATRMTIKVADSPNDSQDPLVRVCLPLFDSTASMN